MNKKTNLIWIDLEMTGLIPESDVIIEIATVVTDANLKVIDEGPSLGLKKIILMLTISYSKLVKKLL